MRRLSLCSRLDRYTPGGYLPCGSIPRRGIAEKEALMTASALTTALPTSELSRVYCVASLIRAISTISGVAPVDATETALSALVGCRSEDQLRRLLNRIAVTVKHLRHVSRSPSRSR